MDKPQPTINSLIEETLAQLDKVGRNQWHNVILMQLTQAVELGHSNGYKAAKAEEARITALNPLNFPSVDDAFAKVVSGTFPEGEDKSLSASKPTEEEAAEGLGHDILNFLAVQLGRYAINHNLTPGSFILNPSYNPQNTADIHSIVTVKVKH